MDLQEYRNTRNTIVNAHLLARMHGTQDCHITLEASLDARCMLHGKHLWSCNCHISRKDEWERITHTRTLMQNKEAPMFDMLHCDYNLNI